MQMFLNCQDSLFNLFIGENGNYMIYSLFVTFRTLYNNKQYRVYVVRHCFVFNTQNGSLTVVTRKRERFSSLVFLFIIKCQKWNISWQKNLSIIRNKKNQPFFSIRWEQRRQLSLSFLETIVPLQIQH